MDDLHEIEFVQCTFTFTFSRRFYPKRLTGYSGYTFFYPYVCSPGNEPTTFCTANTMLYHWATGTLCISWLSVQYNKKLHIGGFSTKVGTLWSVLYFYCNWKISAKTKHGSRREWESFFWDFPQIFQLDWDGMRFFFVGVGQERFENPCHSLLYHSLKKKGELLEACPGRS